MTNRSPDEAPYTGPFELLTLEQAAGRCGCSADHFLSVYDGHRLYLGEGKSLLRFPAWALHEWSCRQVASGIQAQGGTVWDQVGDGPKAEKRVRRGQAG